MRIFGTLIWGWNKPYLELSDFAENWNGESLQHMLDAKSAASHAAATVTAKIENKHKKSYDTSILGF